jgi:glycosyltransferase involved in cell wall biosynthesis
MDTVRKCLDSIMPLMDAFPCELIVVDTVGPEHSDGSLAVAREYTNRIVHFDWCDDFAAARNAGLGLAQGEWFLFLDDDEWFDDVSAIIDFLKSDEPQYNVCQHKVRNYLDRGGQHYSDVYVHRLFRRHKTLHFEGKIHELMIGAMPMIRTLDAFVHHYGYAFGSREDFMKHSFRNTRSLEQILADQPGNLRIITHLAPEYNQCNKFKETEDMCREALDCVSASPDAANYQSLIACYYMHALFSQKKWNEVLDQSERLLNRSDISELAKAYICVQRNECSYAIFDSEKLLSNVDQYFRFLDILDADPDKLASQQATALDEGQSESTRASVMECGLKRACALGDEKRCRAYIARISKNPGEHHAILDKNMPPMIRFATETDSLNMLYSLIEPHLHRDSSLSCFLSSVQAYLDSFKEYEKPVGLIDFLSSLPLDKPYIILLKMRAAEKAGDPQRLAELFNHYTDQESLGFSHELLQVAYRNRLDFCRCAGKFPIDEWNSSMQLLVNSCSFDQTRGILQYLRGYFPEDSPEVLSLEIEFRLKMLKESREQDSQQQIEGFRQYVDLLYSFHLGLNNERNFSEERSNYLSAGAQAAFFLKQSFDYGLKGDLASQVQMLKKALSRQNSLVDFVDLIIKNLNKQIEGKKSAAKAQANLEMQALGARLKSVVAEFILKGDYKSARDVLDQLNQFLPGDPDISRLYMQLYQ